MLFLRMLVKILFTYNLYKNNIHVSFIYIIFTEKITESTIEEHHIWNISANIYFDIDL